MTAKSMVILCVLTMVTTTFVTCVPVSANTGDSVTVNSSSLTNKTGNGHSGLVVSPMNSMNQPCTTVKTGLIEGVWKFDYTDNHPPNTGGNRYEGLFVSNISYLYNGAYKLMVLNAYQSGVRFKFDSYVWQVPSSDSNHYATCLANTWFDTDYWHHNNVYTFNWTVGTDKIQVIYTAEFCVYTTDSNYPIQFVNYISWKKISGNPTFSDLEAWWKIEFLIDNVASTPYRGNTAISVNSEWNAYSEYVTNSTTISFKKNANRYMYTYYRAEYTQSTQHWAAIDTPPPVSSFKESLNNNGNSYNHSPEGSEQVLLSSPSQNTNYYSITAWAPVYS